MKTPLVICLIALCFSCHAATQEGYVIITDTSELSFLNPDLEVRETAKMKLDNGLEILLISDPAADQSAATVAVQVGSWDDPVAFPGMAHFCEHMLFMGTKKYPDENGFTALLADYNGKTNASTSASQTTYMFSCQEEGFIPLLDQFAHFFIDPLFNPSNIAREMHAVDQECAKITEHDGWRMGMIIKETGNQDHPNRMFSCGNSETLSQIPQTALIEWHQKHYSAGKMRAAIYSSLPLEELKKEALAAFSGVQPSDVPPNLDPTIPLLSAKQKGHITYIKPIQNKQDLVCLWELPYDLADDPSQSAQLVAYALKRGQKYSLYEKLKEEQLINSLSVSIEDLGGKEHRFFEISCDLTDKGIHQIDNILFTIYQAIALIRKGGVPHYLFEEKNTVSKLNYEYQGRKEAFSYIAKLGSTLFYEPLRSYPKEQVLARDYNPKKIHSVASFLTPERCAIYCLADPLVTTVPTDKKERWLGAEYTIQQVPPLWIDHWSRAELHPDIRIAEPNPFVAHQLEITADPHLGDFPVLIAQNDLGTAYYARCPEYQTPEISAKIHISSPELAANARSQVLSALYCDHLTDLLHPVLSAASQAGFQIEIGADKAKLHIKVDGFHPKMSLLLQTILKKLPLHPPTAEQFAIYTARWEKEYSNAQKELACKQAKQLADSIIHLDRITPIEKGKALKTIQFDDFLNFHKKLFEKTYTEAFFGGNLSLKEAESAWIDVMHIVGKNPYPAEERFKNQVIELPVGPFSVHQSVAVQGNAALLVIDEGIFSPTNRAVQDIMAAPLQEIFFNELRTKQKTGYIVRSESAEIENRLFQFFIVQSNSHQPEDLLYRFELVLEDFLQDLETHISPSRFETLKLSAITSLKNRFRNLQDKTMLWDMLAFSYLADFFFIEKRIEGIQNLSYTTFQSIAHQFLSRKNLKRLAIFLEGKLIAPFAYEPTTTDHLSEMAVYTSRGAKIGD